MRRTTLLLLLLAVVPVLGAPRALARPGARRWVRCCLELAIPGVPPGPICAQVHGRFGIRPRRACRLLGGRPIGRGDCSIAACRTPA